MSTLAESALSQFSILDEKFRALAFRERVMVSCLLIASVGFAIDVGIAQSTNDERNRISLAAGRTQENILKSEQEMTRLTRFEMSDDERRAQEEIKQLKRQLAQIDSQMGMQVTSLIPPHEIVSVLEDLLASDTRLTLVRLESQAPEQVGQTSQPEASTQDIALYRHGLRLVIEGNYGSVLNYLQRLEDSKWNLLWDRFEYRVQKHPTATVTIDLYTLSEQEEWVGV